MSKHKHVLLLTIILLSVVFAVGPSQVANAAIIFIVNDNGDTDDADLSDSVCDIDLGTLGNQCTLRAAIQEANDEPGIDTIEFNLGGGSPYVISPATALPIITGRLFIDGASQTGYSSGSPVVEINGGGQSFNGLELSSSGNTIFGLVIRDFDGAGIKLTGSSGGSIISGNYIGLNLAGNSAAGNAVGIHILDSPENLIGGSSASEQNIISGNNGAGIIIEGTASDGNIITRNIIGMNAGKNAGVGNADEGILIDAAINTTIGSPNTSKFNIISSNDSHGIKITNAASGTSVRGNRIGTNLEGPGDFGNGGDGVWLDSSDNQVGGTNLAAKNIIRFNGGNGVTVSDGENTNVILGNVIRNNSELGIDLNDDGITVNDPGDQDNGANYLVNYPIISTASLSGSTLNIKGGYNSKVGLNSFRLEFFSNNGCDPSGNGEGAKRIHTVNITTTTSGNYTIDVSFSSYVSTGDYITATATWMPDGSTPTDTSEFSSCWLVSAVTATATNTVVPTATSGGGGGATATSSGVNSPTPSKTPTFTVTGTPPTATMSPTITPNNPEKTLTALATINAPSQTSTFSPFLLTNTVTPSLSPTFDLTKQASGGLTGTDIPTPTSPSLLTIGDLTATAESAGSLGQIAGFEVTTILYLCVGLAVLLLLAGGGVELVRWLNSRRDEDDDTF